MMRAFAALAFATCATLAQAQPPADPASERDAKTIPETFNTYDVNRDGKIDRTEASRDLALLSQFERLDHDNNRGIDAAEFGRFEAAVNAEKSPERAPPPPVPPARPYPDEPAPPGPPPHAD